MSGRRWRRRGGARRTPAAWRTTARAPLDALRAIAANRALRRVQAAWGLSILATWTYTVALAVYAYRAGGAEAVALAVVLRSIPAALAGPAIGALTARRERSTVMVAGMAVSAAALAASAAAALSGMPALVVYLLGVVVATGAMAVRTALGAILPDLSDDPHQLVSANVLTGALESVGVFAGPSLAALLLAVLEPDGVFVAAAALLGLATLDLARVRGGGAAGAPGHRADTGLRATLADRSVRLVLGLVLAQTFVSGALSVFYALIALDLLDMGPSGVGLLTAAWGLGGVLGSIGAFALAGRRRLGGMLGLSLLLWGVPLALLGLVGEPAPALALLAVVGLGNVLFDVVAVTLLQRTTPDAALAQALGALESVVVFGLGLGAVVAAPLASAVGVRAALGIVGAILPVAAIVSRRALARTDDAARLPVRQLDVLRAVPLFRGLPGPVLESLAFGARTARIAAGGPVVREGEVGDRYYAIVAGELSVTQGGRELRTLHPGDGFGEIALLRDVPRTATVRATSDVEVLTLERAPFLAAMTTDPSSRRAAEELVASRLAGGPA